MSWPALIQGQFKSSCMLNHPPLKLWVRISTTTVGLSFWGSYKYCQLTIRNLFVVTVFCLYAHSTYLAILYKEFLHLLCHLQQLCARISTLHVSATIGNLNLYVYRSCSNSYQIASTFISVYVFRQHSRTLITWLSARSLYNSQALSKEYQMNKSSISALVIGIISPEPPLD